MGRFVILQPLALMARYTSIPSSRLYLTPLLPPSAATISASTGDLPTQHTPVYHIIPSTWLQIPTQARRPTKLHAKWSFLTIEPQAVLSLTGYVILDASRMPIGHFGRTAHPPLEPGSGSHLYSTLLVILNRLCVDWILIYITCVQHVIGTTDSISTGMFTND